MSPFPYTDRAKCHSARPTMSTAETARLPTPGTLSRRHLLRAALLATSGALAAQAGVAFTAYLRTEPHTVVSAGNLADLPVGSVTWLPRGKYFLVRTEDGLLALRGKNTARCGGPVES